MTHPILIFSDGASSGNPGPGGWGAIIATPDEVIELGGSDPHTTNNRMELLAAIHALARIKDLNLTTARPSPSIEVHTDSKYLIQGITQWIWGWKKKGWITQEGKEVLNKDLWQKLLQLTNNSLINWRYVPGHSGIPGNERADQIAVEFSKRRSPDLYEGPRSQYWVSLDPEPREGPPPSRANTRKSQKKAHSYLSLVQNQVKRHSTWTECEAWVKGRSGAKFKKALSPEDEAAILKEWGIADTFADE